MLARIKGCHTAREAMDMEWYAHVSASTTAVLLAQTQRTMKSVGVTFKNKLMFRFISNTILVSQK